MTFGFVYVLVSQSMPDVLKIGQTEKSPRQRAVELSRATGVPTPFEVVCYIDVESPAKVEKVIHKRLAHLRLSNSREFFRNDKSLEALRTVCMYPDRLGLCKESYELVVIEQAAGVEDIWELPDPWAPAPRAVNSEARRGA